MQYTALPALRVRDERGSLSAAALMIGDENEKYDYGRLDRSKRSSVHKIMTGGTSGVLPTVSYAVDALGSAHEAMKAPLGSSIKRSDFDGSSFRFVETTLDSEATRQHVVGA